MSDEIRVAILTVSDSVVAGTRGDLSGPALAARCRGLGWQIVADDAVADDEDAIAARLAAWADSDTASLVLTTGGTGIAARDVTPEATRSILDRELPGLGELMRVRGLEQTRFAPLSRGTAGSRGRTLIVNLPGSPDGAVFSFDLVAPLAPHAVSLLNGRTEHAEPETRKEREASQD